MQSELERLEKLEKIKWHEYRLGDLLTFEAIKQAKSQKEIPTDNTENGVPYIVQSMFNNMFSRKVNRQWLIEHNEAPVSGNRIVLGVTLPAVSYQPREFGASQVITARAGWLNSKNGIFIATSISKQLYRFSYAKKPGLQVYKDMKIQLPVILGVDSKPVIAFHFMEKFIATLEAERIATLEAERIATLEAYLRITGLKNYNLTKQEKVAFERMDEVEWREFNLESLFGKSQRGKRLKSADRMGGGLPFVTAGETNTGISAWIGNNVQIFPRNTVTIDMFGSAKYRNYDYGADDHVAVVNTEKLSKFSAIFLTSAIHKSAHAGQFDYSRNFYASDADELQISLPIKSDKTPDYDFMDNFVSAVQKIIIRNVVEYLDKRIEKTEEFIA